MSGCRQTPLQDKLPNQLAVNKPATKVVEKTLEVARQEHPRELHV
jgi:hypothetical protein